MSKAQLTVSEAAEFLGVSVDTIRRWNKKGLVKASRSASNHRLFSALELERLNNKIHGQAGDVNHYTILKAPSVPEPPTCIDLFAGGGGTALGLENAGLKHLLLSERDRDAVATLRCNRPDWNVVAGDVVDIDFSDLNADVVEAGFPCQAFSYAGKSLGFADTRGTLFREFARCVEQVRPRIAIGENVRGLLTHDNGRTLQVMVSVLQKLGYEVAYKVLRAQYLDVPQKRERLIIMAVREGEDLPLLFPRERDYTVSIREALSAGGGCPESPGQQYTDRKKSVMELVPPGGYWRDLPDDIQKEYMGASYHLGGGKTGMARRLAWDEPSLTLTCNPAQKQTERCHPEETRPLSVREYARIQTFPDEWAFAGSMASQYRQIGNAVPVNMGYHIGRAAIAMLSGADRDDFDELTPVRAIG